jgi:hypothetical protein
MIIFNDLDKNDFSDLFQMLVIAFLDSFFNFYHQTYMIEINDENFFKFTYFIYIRMK